MSISIKDLIEYFWKYYSCSGVEIYNEISLQIELGIFLRSWLPSYKVEFERNIKCFLPGISTVKHEIDIVIYNENEKYAIELKFPRNGQYPESMYSFIKDIKFMEEAKAGGFTKTAVLTVVDDKNFYDGTATGIYQYFRGATPEAIQGKIYKPTGVGKESEYFDISGSYSICWKEIDAKLKYYSLIF